MKKIFLTFSIVSLLLGACSNDQQPTPQEQKKVEDQVAKDQAAQDSMEAVILQQINAGSADSSAEETH